MLVFICNRKKSTKNKEIRKKKTLNHITGRKPFSVVRVEVYSFFIFQIEIVYFDFVT